MNNVSSIGSKRFKELRNTYLLGEVPMAFLRGDVKVSGDFISNDTDRMEKYIQKRLPKRMKIDELPPKHIVIGLGLYLGEIIVKQLEDHWYTYTKNIVWDTVVQVNPEDGPDIEVKPFARTIVGTETKGLPRGTIELKMDMKVGYLNRITLPVLLF